MGRMNQPNLPRFTPHGLVPTQEQTAIQLCQSKVVLIDANAGAAKDHHAGLAHGRGDRAQTGAGADSGPDIYSRSARCDAPAPVGCRRPLCSGTPHRGADLEDFAALQLERIDAGDVRACRKLAS